MHPQIFLFSRTLKRDYQYLFPLPADCPADCTAFIRTQLEQMQLGKADRTMQVWVGEANAVVLRSTVSGNVDLYSRPIYALEGFYFPEDDIRELWLSLPDWLPGFCAAPSLYQKLLQEEQLRTVPPEEFINEFTKAASQFQIDALKQVILETDIPFSFSMDAHGMHPMTPLSKKQRTIWVPNETRRCQIQLVFNRKEKTAQLKAVSCGKPEYVIVQSPLVRQKEMGWQFSELETAACAIEQFLHAAGWQYRMEGDSMA